MGVYSAHLACQLTTPNSVSIFIGRLPGYNTAVSRKGTFGNGHTHRKSPVQVIVPVGAWMNVPNNAKSCWKVIQTRESLEQMLHPAVIALLKYAFAPCCLCYMYHSVPSFHHFQAGVESSSLSLRTQGEYNFLCKALSGS